jgi:5-methylcytosine-specific restriction endonuclease McrA
MSEIKKAWRENNSEKKRAADSAWYQNNKAAKDAYTRQYMKKHPEKRRAGNQNRRGAMSNAGYFDPDDWVKVLNRYGSRCLRCKVYDNLSLDHIVPLSKGGKNVFSNYQVLCRSCNSWKGTKIIDFRGVDSSISGLVD